MLALTIPKFFFNVWFLSAIMAVIIIIHYFWGKTPPPPKPSKFLTKHKKAINKIMDVCIICVVLVYCLLLMSFPIIQIFDALSAPAPIRATDLQVVLAFFLMELIISSGFSGLFIGFLSVFQSNLTKVKRIILLIISLLPIAFTTLLLLIEPSAKHWSTIKLGLNCTAGCWIINGPAILIGKHFFPVSWNIMRKLRWVSGDYPG
jgi:hypothetical protein